MLIYLLSEQWSWVKLKYGAWGLKKNIHTWRLGTDRGTDYIIHFISDRHTQISILKYLNKMSQIPATNLMFGTLIKLWFNNQAFRSKLHNFQSDILGNTYDVRQFIMLPSIETGLDLDFPVNMYLHRKQISEKLPI